MRRITIGKQRSSLNTLETVIILILSQNYGLLTILIIQFPLVSLIAFNPYKRIIYHHRVNKTLVEQATKSLSFEIKVSSVSQNRQPNG